MEFPGDETMLLLLAVQAGQPLEPVGGELTVPVPVRGGGVRVIADVSGELDALEERGWVSVETDPPTVTERGRYALERWMVKRLKVRVAAGTIRMGVFR